MEDNRQEEPLDLSTHTQFQCPLCTKTFEQRRYLTQHEQKHKPPATTCTICQPPMPFQRRSALVNHRAKAHGVLPYLCGKEGCEQAFATNPELQEHWKENHTKCDRCNGVFLTPAGLKLHQRKCVALDAESFPSFHSMDSGVASDESKDSRTSEISIASSSSSIRSNESRHREDNKVPVKASLSKKITPDMRHVMFGLPTASAALVFAHARGISNVDEKILDKILKEGQSLFKKLARPSVSGGPHGSVSPAEMERPIHIDLTDASLTLTYSPEGVPNPAPKFVGSFNRNEVFRGFSSFSKVYDLAVLQVGELYMALVFEHDFLYVVNPGIGTSDKVQDSSDLHFVCVSVKKCHRRGWHALVDEIIESFKLENNCSDQLEFVIMPAFISRTG